jgi:hypothetical protein
VITRALTNDGRKLGMLRLSRELLTLVFRSRHLSQACAVRWRSGGVGAGALAWNTCFDSEGVFLSGVGLPSGVTGLGGDSAPREAGEGSARGVFNLVDSMLGVDGMTTCLPVVKGFYTAGLTANLKLIDWKENLIIEDLIGSSRVQLERRIIL